MINNMQVNNTEDLDVVIPMLEYSNKYLKTSRSLWVLQRLSKG